MKNEILKYRMLTIVFAIFAFGSIGTFTGFSSLARVCATFVSFSSASLYFFVREEELVRQYKESRKAQTRRNRLTVYSENHHGNASVA